MKILRVVFIDAKGVNRKEFVPPGYTVSALYITLSFSKNWDKSLLGVKGDQQCLGGQSWQCYLHSSARP